MTDFAPVYKVRSASGTYGNTAFPSGVISEVASATYSLGDHAGLLGATIELLGTVNDAFKIAIGEIVELWHDAGEMVYRGIVSLQQNSVDGTSHVYELQGWWALLKYVDMSERVVFGTDITANDAGTTTGERHVTATNTPEAIVKWLVDNRIGPAWGTSWQSGDIAASGVTLSNFLIAAEDDLQKILEQLELIASANSGGLLYVAGIDEANHFYFHPVSMAEEAIQATYTIGQDTYAGNQDSDKQIIGNVIDVVGSVNPTTGFVPRNTYTKPASITTNGRSMKRTILAPALRGAADQAMLATGYLNKYGDLKRSFTSTERVHHGEAVPRPWLGQCRITSVALGDLLTDRLAQVDVTMDFEYRYVATIGRDNPNASGSAYAPSLNNDMAVYQTFGSGGIGSMLDPIIPSSSYTDEPGLVGPLIPPEQLPPGTGETTGSGSGFVLGGLVELIINGPVRLITGELVKPIARVSNGGDNTKLRTETNPTPVTFFFSAWHWVSGTLTHVETSNVVATFLSEANGIETYTCNPGGFQPSADSLIFVAVKVTTETAPTPPATTPTPVYTWWPADVTSEGDYLKCPYTRCLDVANSVGGNTVTVIQPAGWAVTGA